MQNQKIEHLYIHWPFCKNKCHYCDFISFEKHEGFEKEYHNALCTEINEFVKENEKAFAPITTVFLGGGTPSLYPLDLLKELFGNLKQNFNLEKLQEVTIEANPKDITEENLAIWKRLGFNRLSIGVQILNDKILKNLNRIQTKKDVFKALTLAPKYFENISVDLILGLPGMTQKNWEYTLETLLKFPIKHISIYLLTIYEKTPLFFSIENQKTKLIQEAKLIEFYQNTVKFLKKNEFDQYEISNFAKPNFESIHNRAYWDRKTYRGFGLGSSSFYASIRTINEKNLAKYLKNSVNTNKIQLLSTEKLTKQQEILETLMLGLRQKKGIDLQRMLYSLKNREKEKFIKSLKILKDEGLLQEAGGNITLTSKGMLLENEIILRLL
jgi:oxygen-independent coproporphyrinogen III oxidase